MIKKDGLFWSFLIGGCLATWLAIIVLWKMWGVMDAFEKGAKAKTKADATVACTTADLAVTARIKARRTVPLWMHDRVNACAR